MAKPLRFRYSPEHWDDGRVRRQILQPLQANLGARSVTPWYAVSGDRETHRFEMDNGDLALFARSDDDAHWVGNTETPQELWRTDKFGWTEVPYPVARWAQRELLATLHETAPWLRDYPYLSWFFLPVFMSKDGRTSTRRFFREHAGGFPDADWKTGVGFFEEFLRTGVLDEHRHTMAGKLGTSRQVDHVRMSAAMSEFIAAKLLTDAGYDITPEIEVTTGHSLDFRAGDGSGSVLVEVTRPMAPDRRAASGGVGSVTDTAATKTNGQLAAHGGGAVLFVDCSNFDGGQWAEVRSERPDVGHRPAVVYRARPGGHIEGYHKGRVPIELGSAMTVLG